MRLLPAAAVAVTAALVPVAQGAAAAPAPPVTVTVRSQRVVGTVNERLVGFNWHPGPVPLSTVAPLEPAVVRLDASLERVSPAPGRLDLTDLLAQVAQIRAIGAEPLVILSYTPPWLSRAPALLGDATKAAPRDLGAWQRLVHDVVRALATSPAPARWFEAWNEPELPTFWAGLPTEWLDVAAASARAVHQVSAETGLHLTFGGPASVIPDPVLLAALRARLAAQGTPLGFASWHQYGNLPCLGPDGPEPGLPGGEVQSLLGCRNPLASPIALGLGVEVERAASLHGARGMPRPALGLDEWNLSSGGLDRRHDTVAGAAFDATTLVQLQAHQVDWAAFFKATDGSPGPGDLGLVHLDGRRKPAWWSFWLWRQLAPMQVATRTSGAGVAGPEVLASRTADGGRLTTLLTSFAESCRGERRVVLRLGAAPASALVTVRRLDDQHADAAVAEPVPAPRGVVHLRMPACSVVLVERTMD